jgi:hypothetical protein
MADSWSSEIMYRVSALRDSTSRTGVEELLVR